MRQNDLGPACLNASVGHGILNVQDASKLYYETDMACLSSLTKFVKQIANNTAPCVTGLRISTGY